jgi:hypothetical protein
MKIFFSTVCIDKFPVIWEELESTPNQLRCCYKLVGSKPMDKQLMLEKLEKIDGVTIDSGEAIIRDAENFYRLHQDKTCLSVGFHSRIRNAFFTADIASIKLNDESASKVQRQRSPQMSPKIITPRSILSPKSDGAKRGIDLDTLIPNTETNSGLWGDTVSHETYFTEKTEEDAVNRQYKLLKSNSRLFAELQYKKNKKVGKIRKQLIIEIRHLFDEILDKPFLRICGNEPTLPALVKYFQDAILKAMVTTPYDYSPTEYEKMPSADRLELFPDDTEYQFANNQMRLARANIKLRPLLFFIDDKILSIHLTNDIKLSNYLDTLKLYFKPLILEITNSISNLQNLLIELGMKLYQCQLAEQKLKDAINNRHPSINEFISFSVLINQFLKEKLGLESDYLHKKIIEDAIARIYKYIDEDIAKGQISPPRGGDSDFYLSKELANSLLILFNNENKSLKNSLKSDNWEHQLSQFICKELNNCILKELLQTHSLRSFHSMIQSCLKSHPSMKIKEKDLVEIQEIIVTQILALIKTKASDNLQKLKKILVITHNNDDFFLSNSLAENIILPLQKALPATQTLKKSKSTKYLSIITNEIYNNIFEPHFNGLLEKQVSESAEQKRAETVDNDEETISSYTMK